MKKYYRIMLGKKSAHAEECFAGNFIGSDAVVGQVLRYMGFVQEQLAEPGQTVRGAIIALEDDKRIRQALKMTPAADFFKYEIDFRLVKA